MPRTHGVFILQVAVFSKTFEVQPYLGKIPILLTKVETTNC